MHSSPTDLSPLVIFFFFKHIYVCKRYNCAICSASDVKQNEKHYQGKGGVAEWHFPSVEWCHDVFFCCSAVAGLFLPVQYVYIYFFSCVWKKKHLKRKYSFRPKPISFSNIRIRFSYLIGVTFEWNHQLAFLTLSHPNLQKVTQKYNLSFFFFLFFGLSAIRIGVVSRYICEETVTQKWW